MKLVVRVLLITFGVAGCTTTLAPVAIGKDTYLIEGGPGLATAPLSELAKKANEFCTGKGLHMTVLGWQESVPSTMQFSCAAESSPVRLRPDNGVTTIEHR